MSGSTKSVIVGTAGHIDHGKSALVEALTGTHPDRLEEEKRRGITIDLGFAFLEEAGTRFGFIDVPGHERFVSNMLAGAAGIDLVLLVVAADESIKPQTREHFDICRLLGVQHGIVALTKSDLVDADTLELVRLEVEEYLRGSFLEKAPIVPVSAKTRAGLAELTQALLTVSAQVRGKDAAQYFRLPIDRSFAMKGFGAVITGTLISGSVVAGDEVELFPEGRRLRVRGVQSGGKAVQRAVAGQRTAINLAGIEHNALRRGMALATPGKFRVTRRIDARLDLLPSAPKLKNRCKVHLHLGTSELIAEVILDGGTRELLPGRTAFAQFHLQEELLALPGDRFIIRQFSPVTTIGGGLVLDPLARRPKLKDTGRTQLLEIIARGNSSEILAAMVGRAAFGLGLDELIARTGWIETDMRIAAALGGGHGTSFAQGAAEPARPGIAVWDTGTPSAELLAVAAVEQKTGWKRIQSGETVNGFQGDAVISNGRLLAVARQQGSGIEVYSLGLGKPIFRGRLLLAPGAASDRIALTENGRAAVSLEVASRLGVARFRLKRGELFIESQAVSGEATLRVECPSRFAVLPDFFADDILFDARKVSLDKVELPSENFLLHFTGKQDAIVMSVFENRAQDVRVTLAGKGDDRAVTGSEIDFGKKGSKIWVAVLEGAGTWHSLEVQPAQAGKILPLEWKMPFVAQWRVDFTRKDGLTDSWDMLLPEKEGHGFIKPSWLAQDGQISKPTRTATGEVDRDAYKPGGPASDRLGPDRRRWTTVLGHVPYPCWSDHERNGFLQPLKHKRVTFDGPVLIYALNRLAETPVTSYTPVDIVRNTLGVGPCQYILDVEGQKQEHVGRATCHVRTLLNEVYGSHRQKEMRKEIENYLGDALDFVTHIRNRVLAYVSFGKDLRKYLAEERVAHPELKEALDELEALTREIDVRVESRIQAILRHQMLKETVAEVQKQQAEPTPPALAAQLNRDFVAKGLLDYEGADWARKLKKEYTDALTAIGGEQDEMVGECRWVVKALRQKAGILMATDPRLAPVAAEIRARTQKMLRGGAAYEGARH